ncbi:MAG: Rrf2 family transcriptional regulator [Deltaproteobacteria bacterium]|nr:Rrf2 family transcriptional regulator [Deltaproteobacteria bacterium]
MAIVETLIGEETPLSSRQLAELLNRHQSTIVRICRRLKQDGILAVRRGRNSGYFLKK